MSNLIKSKSELSASAKQGAKAGAQNIVEKIWNAHVVSQEEGHPAVFAIDLMLLHEVTSAQAFQTLEAKKLPVFDASRLLATIDHSIPTRTNRWEIYDEAARTQVETLRRNCERHGIRFLDFDGGQGIVHVVGPELGLACAGYRLFVAGEAQFNAC
jgi:3-isopropylmalate/(R)-2-methylmalate dehydratase large subunit